MSYYLTMSLFPLIICLYALLGNSYQQMPRMLELADRFLSRRPPAMSKSFLHLCGQQSQPGPWLVAAIPLLLSSASAAVRVMLQGLREIRGERRGGRACRSWLFSFVFSIAFVAAMYFGILVMLTGRSFLQLLERLVPVLHISRAWNWLRFLVLGGLVFLTLWGVYVVCPPCMEAERPRPRALWARWGSFS